MQIIRNIFNAKTLKTGVNFIILQIATTALLFCYQYYLAFLTDERIVSYYVIIHTTANGFFTLLSLGFNQASIYYKTKVNFTRQYVSYLSYFQAAILISTCLTGLIFPNLRLYLISLTYFAFNLSNLSLLAQDKYKEFNIRKILSVIFLFVFTYGLYQFNSVISKHEIEIIYFISLLPLIQIRYKNNSISLQRFLLIFQTYWKYGKNAYLSNVITFLSYRGPIYISLFLLGYESQANFSLALTASEVIFILVNLSNTYIFSHFSNSKKIQDNEKNIKKLSNYFLIIASGISITTGLFLPFIIPPDFDQITIIRLFIALSISNLIFIPVKFNSTIFLLRNNTGAILKISMIHSITLNFLFLVSCYFFDIITAASLSILAYLITLGYSNNLLRRNEYVLY